MWKKCGLEGVIENEMTDRFADKLQYKNQIFPDDDWIRNFANKRRVASLNVGGRLPLESRSFILSYLLPFKSFVMSSKTFFKDFQCRRFRLF